MVAIPNLLLASLPRREYLRLVPGLTPVDLTFGDILYEAGSRMRYVYFPTASLVSLLTVVEGHLALEVGLVGPEGVVGIPLSLGINVSPVRALVQGGGAALRMSREGFLSALRFSPSLQRASNAYVHSLMGQIAQTAACNRFHVVGARLARWLLMTRDRVGSGEFRMTHEFLSSMLGVRREGVTVAASTFNRQHLIEYTRGKIKILDHPGLEAAACSCYRLAGTVPGALKHWRPGTPGPTQA
jgi:CRP-like cAMP-binding protein